MSKRPFVIFGIFVAVLGGRHPPVGVQLQRRTGQGLAQRSPPTSAGKTLFVTNCGTCHTLDAAGTDGNFAPNLDILLAPAGPPTGPTAKQTITGTRAGS